MPDVGVGQIDDVLPGLLEVTGVLVDHWNPADRLMRRRDVVAVGREDDQRISNATKIDAAMLVDPHPALLQLIADEQVFDNRYHLFPAKPIEPAPPSLELEEALALRIDVCEEMGV